MRMCMSSVRCTALCACVRAVRCGTCGACVRCGEVWCGAMRCGAVQCGAVQCSAVLYGARMRSFVCSCVRACFCTDAHGCEHEQPA